MGKDLKQSQFSAYEVSNPTVTPRGTCLHQKGKFDLNYKINNINSAVWTYEA